MPWVAHESGPDGVPEDVEDRAAELLVVADRLRAEPALEEVADATVAEVVPLGMPAVQQLDAPREAWLADLED